VKLLSDVRVFFPNREDFDFSRAVQYSASPLHFVFGRREDITARSLFRDIVHASLQPDLNSYSGFALPVQTESEGLMSLTWGKTFMMHEGKRSFQGIYVGAGPYLAARATFDFEAELERILSGTGNRYVPFASMGVGGGETDELALDITGSYRARFPLFADDSGGVNRNGMYVVANYHHLQGFRFDQFDARLQLDTDANGLLVPDPPERPFSLTWHKSSKGIGLSMDFGVAFVVNRWDFGAGVSGVANRIKWRDITEHELSLVSLFNGTEFVHVKLPRRDLTTQIEMPVTYTGDVSYHRDAWSTYTEYSNGRRNQFPSGRGIQIRSRRTARCRPLFAGQLVSLSRGGIRPDAEFRYRRRPLRHPDVPRAKPPRGVSHFPSIRQEVNGEFRHPSTNRDLINLS